ncbi:C40 family peptidase [Cellulomonas cellasea]|uniref:Cell wall-associated NlpC family hydrolase n=1 Tax=Cellulomonas cellasea TaxID=43670 RepID=A0A7W4YD56_9CELL|nr:C40 family peptidase [Cellulomonas cellasea]MBB2924206.1 cell wall-associated NlpC family hydrolase [Cellulomonas cellasea]
MTGIAAVQARMSELDRLVAPPPVAPRTMSAVAPTARTAGPGGSGTGTSDATFASALAALGVDAGSLGLAATAAPAPVAPVVAAAASGPTGASLVEAAKKYVGTPYVWGGESLAEGGLDCSGLVLRSLADLGVTDVPRTARQQMTLGTPVASLDEARPGDLVVFGGGTHIGIYVGDGRMVDAPKPGQDVTVRDVYTTPTAIRRVLPAEGAAPVSATTTAQGAAADAAAFAARLAGVTA